MPELRLIVSRDPARLLEHAAEGFLTLLRATPENAFPSPPYLLALRQGGIRDDLIALAAERGATGWFDPPLCVFHELPRWLGATDREPCADFERLVLLTTVLRSAGTGVFARLERLEDFVDPVDRLFGELAGEEVTPDEFRTAIGRVSDRGSFERARDADLERAYRAYMTELDRVGMRDGRDTWVDCARALRADPEALVARLGGRREIRIFGLSDLRQGWRALLRALVESPALDRIALYSSEELDLGAGLEPRIEWLDGTHPIADRLFKAEEQSDVQFDLIVAADVDREVEETARRVRALAEQRVPLQRIAVVSRQARPYTDLVVSALERFGVPATARRRIGYTEIPVVRAVLGLFAAAAEGWSRHGLAELASQPYFANELDVRVINFLGFRERLLGLGKWADAFARLEAEVTPKEADSDETEGRRRPVLPLDRVKRARERFTAFALHARALDTPRPLGDWLAWLESFIERDPWGIERSIYGVPVEHVQIARTDLAGWKGLREIVTQWRRAVDRWGAAGEPLTVERFHVHVRAMLVGDAALWTETLRGVRVLEGLAAAYRSFDHVFLVGLTAGRFPVRPPVSALLDRTERLALCAAGLPLDPREAWEARERALFRVLVAGARQRLSVSAARLDETGRDLIPSVFVEELERVATPVKETVAAFRVLTPGLPLFRDPSLGPHAARTAAIERLRETGLLSPYNGQVTDSAELEWLARRVGDEYVWSPTQLESYAKCPWAFFSGRLLGLALLEDPDEDMDPVTRGIILHDALARFFSAASHEVGGPVFLRTADLKWAEPLAARALDDAVAAARAHYWLGDPALAAAKREELSRILVGYLRWEAAQHEEMYDSKRKKAPGMVRTAPAEHEVEIGEAVLDRNAVRVRYRGRIDRVEAGVDERCDARDVIAAVDYKTTEYSTPGSGKAVAWDDGVVLQVPLYAHALVQIRHRRVARVEYRALKNPKVVHSLELLRMDRKTGTLEPDVEAVQRMNEALDAVTEHVKAARRGEFAARPAPSCGCPDFCHGWDICRVQGGPWSLWDW